MATPARPKDVAPPLQPSVLDTDARLRASSAWNIEHITTLWGCDAATAMAMGGRLAALGGGAGLIEGHREAERMAWAQRQYQGWRAAHNGLDRHGWHHHQSYAELVLRGLASLARMSSDSTRPVKHGDAPEKRGGPATKTTPTLDDRRAIDRLSEGLSRASLERQDDVERLARCPFDADTLLVFMDAATREVLKKTDLHCLSKTPPASDEPVRLGDLSMDLLRHQAAVAVAHSQWRAGARVAGIRCRPLPVSGADFLCPMVGDASFFPLLLDRGEITSIEVHLALSWTPPANDGEAALHSRRSTDLDMDRADDDGDDDEDDDGGGGQDAQQVESDLEDDADGSAARPFQFDDSPPPPDAAPPVVPPWRDVDVSGDDGFSSSAKATALFHDCVRVVELQQCVTRRRYSPLPVLAAGSTLVVERDERRSSAAADPADGDSGTAAARPDDGGAEGVDGILDGDDGHDDGDGADERSAARAVLATGSDLGDEGSWWRMCCLFGLPVAEGKHGRLGVRLRFFRPNKVLRPYQMLSISSLLELCVRVKGGINAASMGLGKTAVSYGLVGALRAVSDNLRHITEHSDMHFGPNDTDKTLDDRCARDQANPHALPALCSCHPLIRKYRGMCRGLALILVPPSILENWMSEFVAWHQPLDRDGHSYARFFVVLSELRREHREFRPDVRAAFVERSDPALARLQCPYDARRRRYRVRTDIDDVMIVASDASAVVEHWRPHDWYTDERVSPPAHLAPDYKGTGHVPGIVFHDEAQRARGRRSCVRRTIRGQPSQTLFVANTGTPVEKSPVDLVETWLDIARGPYDRRSGVQRRPPRAKFRRDMAESDVDLLDVPAACRANALVCRHMGRAAGRAAFPAPLPGAAGARQDRAYQHRKAEWDAFKKAFARVCRITHGLAVIMNVDSTLWKRAIAAMPACTVLNVRVPAPAVDPYADAKRRVEARCVREFNDSLQPGRSAAQQAELWLQKMRMRMLCDVIDPAARYAADQADQDSAQAKLLVSLAYDKASFDAFYEDIKDEVGDAPKVKAIVEIWRAMLRRDDPTPHNRKLLIFSCHPLASATIARHLWDARRVRAVAAVGSPKERAAALGAFMTGRPLAPHGWSPDVLCVTHATAGVGFSFPNCYTTVMTGPPLTETMAKQQMGRTRRVAPAQAAREVSVWVLQLAQGMDAWVQSKNDGRLDMVMPMIEAAQERDRRAPWQQPRARGAGGKGKAGASEVVLID